MLLSSLGSTKAHAHKTQRLQVQNGKADSTKETLTVMLTKKPCVSLEAEMNNQSYKQSLMIQSGTFLPAIAWARRRVDVTDQPDLLLQARLCSREGQRHQDNWSSWLIKRDREAGTCPSST